ncbi:MAG: hypothetical protein WDN76_05820 [Alphaproteobacteria bacterium]
MSQKNLFLLGGSSALALLFTAAPSAFAQDAAPAAASEEIVVTGSHIARSTFNAPTPVNVVGEARMKTLAIPQRR